MARCGVTSPWPCGTQRGKARPEWLAHPGQPAVKGRSNRPSSRAAVATTILKTDPGASWAWMTRFSSGLAGSSVNARHCSGGVRGAMDVVVERQADGAARDRFFLVELVPLLAAAVDDAPPLPVRAHQDGVVVALEAHLAD